MHGAGDFFFFCTVFVFRLPRRSRRRRLPAARAHGTRQSFAGLPPPPAYRNPRKLRVSGASPINGVINHGPAGRRDNGVRAAQVRVRVRECVCTYGSRTRLRGELDKRGLGRPGKTGRTREDETSDGFLPGASTYVLYIYTGMLCVRAPFTY